jgi:hypothetical protein
MYVHKYMYVLSNYSFPILQIHLLSFVPEAVDMRTCTRGGFVGTKSSWPLARIPSSVVTRSLVAC